MQDIKVLDLGCGAAKTPGALGVDTSYLPGVDIVMDLTSFPYPFSDNSFDMIYLNDVIEHLPDTIKTMEELYRIIRPNGRIFIRVVNWNSHYATMDPTHVRFFNENSFDFFGARRGRSYYSRARFDVVKVDFQFNKFTAKFLRSKRLMKFLSYYLSNVLEGLNFELRAVKKPLDFKNWYSFHEILRCPNCSHLSHESKVGKLEIFNTSWLVCDNEKCGCKFPTKNGIPVLKISEGFQWQKILKTNLPLISLKEELIEEDLNFLTQLITPRIAGLEKMYSESRLNKKLAAYLIVLFSLLFLVFGAILFSF